METETIEPIERIEPKRSIRTLVVDDHAVYRLGLRAVLAVHRDVAIVGEASDGAEAIAIAAQLPIDVTLVDLRMPGVGGVALARLLRAEHPACKILILSAVAEPIAIAEAIDAGANGYVLKTQEPDEIAEAIRVTMEGACYLPPGVTLAELAELSATQPLRLLSAREREILHLLIAGQSNDDIATSLFIARRTVETHRQRIMKKLGAHTIAELVHVASRFGLVG